MEIENQVIDVSIIVVVYNHEKYIGRALTSLLEQETEYTYEVLIGEDASLDRSKDIIKEFEKKYPEKIRAFYREKNLGATRNGYELCMKARGRYIASLDGDDFWIDKGKIQKQVSFLDQNSKYIGVACNFSRVDKNGNIIKKKCISEEHLNTEFTWQDFLKRGFEIHTSTLMHRNFYLDGEDYSIFYKAHELVGDLTGLTILLNRGNIYILKDIMSAYRRVIDPKESNACSVFKRDTALATIKTVRQYIMLKPYLKNPNDFNRLIAKHKVFFMIQMLKHAEGYTWKRWLELQKLSGFTTNLLIPAASLEMAASRIKRLAKCKRKF